MGRSLGYFDSDELDRPELNKCPDCECYFASEECPLCGKVCPEEMKAGNRAPIKPPKRKKNTSGRVQFIPWYHTWWFILIMMFVMPIVGVILFFSSPYSKKVKIIGAVLGILYFLLIYMGLGFWLFNMLFSDRDLVNNDISREAYAEKCDDMTVMEFFRAGDSAKGDYITMELTVKERITEYQYHNGETLVYYLCYDPASPNTLILLRDCLLTDQQNFLTGEIIRVWGEGAEETLAGYTSDTSYPCLYMAYAEIIN